MEEKEKETNLIDAEGFAELIYGRKESSQLRGYYGFGTVVEVNGRHIVVSLDSSPGSRSKGRRYLDSYKPSKGDRVLILHDVVIGKIK